MGQPPQSTPLVNGLPPLGTASAPSSVVGPFSGVSQLGGGTMRNRIVNGEMDIDQVNAGALVSVNNTNFNGVDKWAYGGTVAAGVFSAQRTAGGPPGFANFLRCTVTTQDAAPAAGSTYLLQTKIEGTYCSDLQFGVAANGQSVTLSFWVRSSLAGTYSGAFRNAGVARCYPFTFAVPAANTWTYVSVTLPADTTGTWATDNTACILLAIDLGNGASLRGAAGSWQAANLLGVTGATRLISTNAATFDLTGVQLEPGTGPTIFERRSLGDRLRQCQREFFKTFNLATAPIQNAGVNTGELYGMAGLAAVSAEFLPVAWPVLMRAAPGVTTFNPAAANANVRDVTAGADCSAVGTLNLTERGGIITASGAAGTLVGDKLGVHLTADARL